MAKKYYTFDQIIDGLKEIAPEIQTENFDVIVAVSRGGLVVAGLLSQLLSCRDIRSMSVVSYQGDSQMDETKVLYRPEIEPNKKILIVDDVIDTGNTAAVVKKAFPEAKIMTLHYKPKGGMIPDFYLWETDQWIVYPWEFNEK